MAQCPRSSTACTRRARGRLVLLEGLLGPVPHLLALFNFNVMQPLLGTHQSEPTACGPWGNIRRQERRWEMLGHVWVSESVDDRVSE